MNAITMKIGVLLKKKQQQKNGNCTHDKTPKQFYRTTEHSSWKNGHIISLLCTEVQNGF